MCLCFYGQHNRILFGLCLEGFLNTTYLHTFFCMISNSVSGSENMKELDWKNSWTWGKKLGIPLVKECGYLNATCNQQRHQCGFSPGNSFRAQCYGNSYLPAYFLVKLHQVTQNESRNLLFIAKIEVSILPFTQVT